MPSITTCATWTPCGANSRASDWARARCANFADANVEKPAEPFNDAVAPVKMRVGEYPSGLLPFADRSRKGKAAWEKWTAPSLLIGECSY